MKFPIKFEVIEKGWRRWSVQLLIGATALAEMERYLPEVKEMLSPDWYRWAFLLILLARLVRQCKLAEQLGGKKE